MIKPKIVTEQPSDSTDYSSEAGGLSGSICPKCHTILDGRGRVCQGCGYHFVLDHRHSPFLSDKAWFDLVEKATENSSTFITADRLYAVFCQHWRQQNPPPKPLGFLLFVATFALLWLDQGELALFTFLGGLVTWFAPFHKPPGPDAFQLAFAAMGRAGRGHAMVLHQSAPSPFTRPPHLPQHPTAVERILVTERRIHADLFMLNGFDLDGKTLIVSAGGYPETALGQARELLLQQPAMPVFIVRDASLKGSRLEKFLKESGFLPLDGHPIYDLGLTEDQAYSLPLFRSLGSWPRDCNSVDILDYQILADAVFLAMETVGDPVAAFGTALKNSTG